MLSIIIPIYNVEKYLERCLESILYQDYSDYEVILVNDGSTDNSLLICNSYQQKDNRIKVYSKGNGGVSSARNFGIDKAKGEWITFIDPDDYIAQHYLEDLICGLNPHMLHVNKQIAVVHGNEENIVVYGYDNIISDTCPNPYERLYNLNLLFSSVWGKIFHRQCLINNNIIFDNAIANGEDRLFVADYLLCDDIKGIAFSDANGYHYQMREGSATHTTINTLSWSISVYKFYDRFKSLNKKYNASDAFLREQSKKIKVMLYDSLLLSLKEKSIPYQEAKRYRPLINELRWINSNKKLDLFFQFLPFPLAIRILRLYYNH